MNCLFCFSANIKEADYPRSTIFNNKIFQYKECQQCGLIFINPLPSDEDFSLMYSQSYHAAFYYDNKPAEDLSCIYELIKAHHPKAKSIVDYGCGDGSLLRFLNKKGFNCFGIEYDQKNISRLRNQNKGISFFSIEEYWNENIVSDVFYTGDVLEHLTAPLNFVKNIQSKIESDGIFIARGPVENNKSFALAVRKAISKARLLSSSNAVSKHVPYHLSFSNALNQQQFFKNAGFNTLHYEISETAWPYPDKFTLSPLSLPYFLIGKMSIFISSLSKRSGNRFVYVGKNITH